MRTLLRLALFFPLTACPFGDDKACDDDCEVEVDVLFVVDNSDSMQEESTALGASLEGFEAALLDAGVTGWRAGITTTSAFYDDGATADIDPGEAGTLIGGTTVDTVDALRTDLLCGATCWDQNLPSDPAHVCGDPMGTEVTEEYLDCECGAGTWSGNCGTGTEQGLEATYMALCRAAGTPPEACYTFPPNSAVAFEPGDEGSNAGLDRDTIVVIVTDEGDSSYRTTEGADVAAVAGDTEIVVEQYTALYAALPNPPRIVVAGPAFDGTDGSCLNGAQEWGVERYQGVATNTGGYYEPLTDLASATCDPVSIDTILAGVAAAAGE